MAASVEEALERAVSGELDEGVGGHSQQCCGRSLGEGAAAGLELALGSLEAVVSGVEVLEVNVAGEGGLSHPWRGIGCDSKP